MPDAAACATAGDRTGYRVAVLAGFLACAGLPLYIHLPRFAAEVGLSLSAAGALLLGLRMIDFVQDPILGWVAERWRRRRSELAGAAILTLGAGFAAVFVLQPSFWGLALALAAIFTAYSLGSILFYAQGVALAEGAGGARHYRLAGWREAGTVVGIVAAAALPAIAASLWGVGSAYVVLGWTVALAAPLVWLAAAPLWQVSPTVERGDGWRDLMHPGALKLLALALLNAMPVAATSTLFLFFVEDRLGLPELAGLYLVLFFAAAGVSAPLWSLLAGRYGARRVLLPAMILAVFAFAWAAVLPSGAAIGFALIVTVSGLALGADMVILPALFAATLARSGLPAGLGFGAWSFAAKLALALAAGLMLPALDAVGYRPGADNGPAALAALNTGYAVLPLILKLPAIWLVARLPDEVL